MKTCVSELFILAPLFKHQRVGLQCDQTVMCLSVVIVVAVDILTFREINVMGTSDCNQTLYKRHSLLFSQFISLCVNILQLRKLISTGERLYSLLFH